jgi:ComF family protein
MSLLENAIGLLAPVECIVCGAESQTLCAKCTYREIIPFGQRCWQCNRLSTGSKTCTSCNSGSSPSHVWLSTTYEKTARELVRKYKFHHQRGAVQSLTAIMQHSLLAYNSFNSLDDSLRLNYLAVPIPTATKRTRQRSFDHTKLLATTLSRQLKIERAEALGRLGQISQVGAPRVLRLHQAEGQYFVRTQNRTAGRNILLIDDVLTTGATLRAATKVLRTAGANRVDALVFAKRL